MPCFTEPEQYENQKRIDDSTAGKHLACRLLTHILFEENQEELIHKLKFEAHKSLVWYKEHLYEDIKYCTEQINYIQTNCEQLRLGREVFYPRGVTREEWIESRKSEIKEWEERKNNREDLLKKVIDMQLGEKK